jgi:hypothetical protein
MSTSKRRSENASVCAQNLQGEQAPATDNGRDARGRFTAGNAGGPGNPFARRVAELRKVLLETVTDDELRIVAGQLMVKAKFGDLAAIKLLFQYVLGKPAATVDPDALDVQEVEMFRRAPVHGEVNEILTARMPAELAAGLLRQVVPYVGQEHANLMYEAITNPEAFAKDRDDLDHLDEAEDLEDQWDLEDEEGSVAEGAVRPGAAAERSGPAPSANGGMNADGRRRATPPSTNGPTFREKPAGRDSGNGDNGGRSPDAPRSEQRPQRGR